MSKRAFVTGGTGFVGSHLVDELLRRGYDEVRCLVRKDPKWLKGKDVVQIKGDLSNAEKLWEGVDGVDYVYHVAGVTRAKDWDTFVKGNVRSTLNVLGAVRAANPGVRKVLITSSLAAVGRCASGVADEQTPLDPISMYGKSKAEMERLLTVPTSDEPSYMDTLPLVVIRPPSVYGPREADIFQAIKAASRGIFAVLGKGNEPDLSLVHARDLVRGMVDAAESPLTTGRTFFLGSEEYYSWNEIRDVLAAALGRRVISIPVPLPLVSAVGALSEFAGLLTGTYPPLNREKAREIRHACKMCSVKLAAQTFGYSQQISLEEGMRETVEWYRKEGWL